MDTISGRRVAGFVALTIAIVVGTLALATLLAGPPPRPTPLPSTVPRTGGPWVTPSPVSPGASPSGLSAPSGPSAPPAESRGPGRSGPDPSIEIPPPID